MNATAKNNVHRLSDHLGPLLTSDFERDAVEALLSSLRKFRGDHGYDPQGLVFAMMHDGQELTFRSGHVSAGGPSPRMLYAFASTALAEAALQA